MEQEAQAPVEGFILELYRNGDMGPCYISSFDPKAVAGFNGYTQDMKEAVIFESRESLLPLAAIEVEAVEGETEEDEHMVFDGFRILPFTGSTDAQLVGNEELEAALAEFEN